MATFVLDHVYNTDKVIPVGTSMMELFPNSTVIGTGSQEEDVTVSTVRVLDQRSCNGPCVGAFLRSIYRK